MLGYAGVAHFGGTPKYILVVVSRVVCSISRIVFYSAMA
jgi:hypothetical protein